MIIQYKIDDKYISKFIHVRGILGLAVVLTLRINEATLWDYPTFGMTPSYFFKDTVGI